MAVLAILQPAWPAHGITFSVTTTNDAGPGSLRQAIQDANTNLGPDTIHFSIPGSGPHTIAPLTALPELSDAVTIDGFSQPGATPNSSSTGNNAVLQIELSGALMGSVDAAGLTITAGNSRIRGFAINGFTNGTAAGIRLTNGGGNIIDGNFIGTDLAGQTSLGNGGVGIAVQNSAGNFVGGASPAGRNLISGNASHGLLIAEATSSNNIVAGNFIGTDATGTGALANGGSGIAVQDAAGNLISGNVISGNSASGVEVAQAGAVANRVLGNSIFNNGGLGIDLLPAGPTPNDPADLDSGPNELQNYPVLTAALTLTNTVVSGSISSARNTTNDLEFFASTTVDPSGHGEGERWVGSASINTDTNGEAVFSVTLNEVVPVGQWISATATDPAGNTSEFSTSQSVVGVSPTITCASNRVVECGTAWDFDLPEATGVCGGTNVTLGESTVTNALCGATFSATRTWLAVDACGNSNSCSQTITVVDTTPPILTCASNRTVECDVAWDFDTPEAADACAGTNVTLTILNTVTNGSCGGSFVVTRTWQAADQCGNTGFCSQIVTGILAAEPLSVTNGLALWLSADSGITTNASGQVSSWLDRSGTGHDASQATSSQSPVWMDGALGGKPVLRFGPGNAFMNVLGQVLSSQQMTLFAVVNSTSTDTSHREIFSNWASTNTLTSVFLGVTNLNPARVRFTDDFYITGVGMLATPDRHFVLTAGSGLSNVFVFQNRNLVASTNRPLSPRNLTAPYFVGRQGGLNGEYWRGDIAEILAYDRELSSEEQGAVWTYLGNKYSLNVGQPSIECPPSLVVSCYAEVPSPDTNAVVTTNAVAVSHLEDLSVTNGCEVVITRTYQAVNSFGDSATCSQTITVADAFPPVLTCASNRTVECPDTWDFDPPLATDVCSTSAPLVFVVDTFTNYLVGPSYSATRIWMALDSCSNSATCSQTVTVVDTMPPVITCSSNLVVECTGGGATVTFGILAVDACDPNVVIVSTPPSGSFFNLGATEVTSVATDSSGNTNLCSFTVTVVDTIPPAIACSTNIIAAEFPFDSGGAVVNFAPPVVSDSCESNLSVSVSPPSGSVFPVGTNTVTCVVADSSGNSNVCSFTIRVIPYRLFVTTNVTTTADSGPGSLRQALLDANDAPGENLVLFNIVGPGPHIITLESPLPEITSPVIINGWSQPGFAGTPLVTVTGAALSNTADGLVLQSPDNTVRGLILNGFATGIKVLGAGNNIIQGNFIGTDSSGLVMAPNTEDGIYVTSGRNLIGGNTNWAANVLGGNGGSGIRGDGPGATNNLVRGNYIGVGVDLLTPLGNGGDGVRLENGAARNAIGGAGLNSANAIAHNLGNGVALLPTAGAGNSIVANSIFGNGLLGIDLGADGVTGNDADDGDPGPNGLINYPILSDARSANGSLQIDGNYTGKGNATYRLDFYLSDVADASGYGEGQRHLGQILLDVYGNGTENFSANFPVSAVYTQQVTATATDFADNTSEFSPAVTVRTPPVLETQPVSTNTLPGGTVVLCSSASGTTPIYYQWRLNGVNIPGATNECYEISAAEYTNGGSYAVVIYNELGASLTVSAGVQVEVTNAVNAADDFVDAAEVIGHGGETAWSNRQATREPGEPLHAGKAGHHSVWYRWVAPEKGVLSVGTRGSDFDTLLGVYRGTNVASLYAEAGDEDRGGYYTSGVRFNALRGRTYHFAVDGYGDDAGRFFLGWQLQETPHLLPAILEPPQSLTVSPGSNATFTVLAARVCGNGFTNCVTPLHYGSPEDPEPTELPNLDCQWLFNGVPIPNATNFSVTISNVQPADLGRYRARIFTPWQTIESADADLEINLTGDTTQPVQAADKLLDVFLLAPWIIGDLLPATPPPDGGASRDTVVRGYTGTQIFNTSGSGTGAADEPICGVLGGASEYITFVPAESGVLFLNTDGSSYDTVMAVFLRNPTNAQLLYLTCDNNGGGDGRDSALSVPVVAGQTNVVLVDGVNGASGVLQLNYSLLSSITLRSVGTTVARENVVQVLSRTNANFSLLRSTNMIHWTPILTTNSPSGVFNYADPQPGNSVRYFYRAQLLP